MSQFLRSNKNRILLILFILTLAPFTAKIFNVDKPVVVKNEKYNEDLKNLTDLDKLISYTDHTFESSDVKQDTAGYVTHLSEVMKQRFYHYDLVYRFSDNWIAWLIGKTLWSHVSFIVLPNDILKHPNAICSQQTIVFMEVLKRKKIDVRSVGLGFDEGPGHFISEVKYNNSWHLYDISIEPDWHKIPDRHMSLDHYLANKDSLYIAYKDRMPKNIYYKILERHTYGETNKMPAKHMRMFHAFTFFFVYFLPLLFGSALFYSFLKSRPKQEQNATGSRETGHLHSRKSLKEEINS